MTEPRKTAVPADRDPSAPGKRRHRSGNLGWRILVLLLVLLLIAALCFGLYSGYFSQLALQAKLDEGARLQESILALRDENAQKDAQIEARGAESVEKDAEIQRLAGEGAEKDAQIDALGTESAERDARLREVEAELAQKDARIQEIEAGIAEKDVQIQELTGQLDAAMAPLLYQDAIRETVPAAAMEALQLPEELEQSEEMKASLLSSLFQGASLGADPAGTREDHLAYRIWAADGQLLGSVAFEPAAQEGSDLPVWTATDERFDFSACFKTTSLVVPADYQVYLGTTPLGPEWIREEDLPYQSFADITDTIEGLPVLVRYETPPFLGDPALWVVNEKGEEIWAEDLSEDLFLDRCPEEIRGQIEAFLPDFVNLFVLFSADIRDSAGYYYGQLKPMVLPDSPLYQRLHDAFEGLGYSAARKAELKSVTVHCVTELGDGRYAVNFNYLTDVTGHSSSFDPVEDDLHMLLILVRTEDGRFLAEALYYL